MQNNDSENVLSSIQTISLEAMRLIISQWLAGGINTLTLET